MFCPNCGHKNDGNKNCSECGVKLVDNQYEKENDDIKYYIFLLLNKIYKNIKDYIKKHKNLSRVTIILLGIIILFNITGSNVSKPEYIAEKYFKYLISQKWSKVYDYMNFTESEFINRKTFVKNMEINGDLHDVSTYKVVPINSYDKENLTVSCNIKYISLNSSFENTYKVILVKQKSNIMLFYPNYKVSPSNDIIGELSIYVPENSTIYIDGIKVSLNELTYQCSLFNGYHNIKVTNPSYGEYVEDIYINKNQSIYVSERNMVQK